MVPAKKSRVSRRRLLATIGTAGAVPVAGCLDRVISSGTTTLDWTGEEIDSDGLERHHFFGGPNPAVTVTLRQEMLASADPRATKPIPFFVLLHHREGLRTDDVQLQVRAPTRDGSPFDAAIYLHTPPNGEWPTLTIQQDTDGWTIIEASPLGRGDGQSVGASNVRFDFMVVPTANHLIVDLFVDVAAKLSEASTIGRRTFKMQRPITFPIATEKPFNAGDQSGTER